MIAISRTHSPVASKLEIALRGNPPPTSSLRTLTLFALLGIVRLGPFRVVPQRSMSDAIIPDVLFISSSNLHNSILKINYVLLYHEHC